MKNHWKSEAGGREAEASAKTTAGVKSYSAFTHEMRQAVAQPPKFHHGLVDFETWRLKMEAILFSSPATQIQKKNSSGVGHVKLKRHLDNLSKTSRSLKRDKKVLVGTFGELLEDHYYY